jgi:hypothetical protein
VPLSTRRRWTEDDLAKLKSMAGMYSSHRIAIELDRGLPAVVMKAFEMRISLKQKRILRLICTSIPPTQDG